MGRIPTIHDEGSGPWFLNVLVKNDADKIVMAFAEWALTVYHLSDDARLQSYDNLVGALKVILDNDVSRHPDLEHLKAHLIKIEENTNSPT